MRTVAIAINKGGVGKTTLTKHLGTAATAAGLNVIILDMDSQQNATSWGKRRSQQRDEPRRFGGGKGARRRVEGRPATIRRQHRARRAFRKGVIRTTAEESRER